jgi:hypothetical protein
MSDAAEFAYHAWLDESMHVKAGLYLLAAAVCEPDCQPIRDTLRSLLDDGQPRLHWSNESPERRQKISATVATIDMAAVVVIGTPLPKRNQERARAVCMESMLVHLHSMGVENVLFEQRDQAGNARDGRIVDSIRGKSLIPVRMRVDWGRPLEEPMLWLPDVVAGAAGADRVHGIPEYLETIGGVEVLDIPLR